MADNRQFTDHNEIGGVNVYLEDKKLAESPEQNTVATTDYVLLKDTDGVPHKISKANMMSVVKDALADLLKNNDLSTNVTKVPALNASAFGSATVANLASVLGDTFKFKRLPDIVVQPNTPTKIMDTNGQSIIFITSESWGHIGMFGTKYIASPEELGITTIFKNCVFYNFDLTQTDQSGVYITSTFQNTYHIFVFG